MIFVQSFVYKHQVVDSILTETHFKNTYNRGNKNPIRSHNVIK